MDRIAVRLLTIASLIGLAMSGFGLVLMVGIRIEQVVNPPFGFQFTSLAESLRHVLDGMKEAGVTFFLSGILYVLCAIARTGYRPHTADEE